MNKSRRKIEMQKTKTRFAAAIAMFLILSISVTLFTLPSANTQGTKKTFAFIAASPNPIGIGQETVLRFGITDQLATTEYSWTGLSVTVTKPDGTIETLNNNGAGFKTDSTGGTYTIYTPTAVGNYTLQAHFPQQTNPAGFGAIPAKQ